jgi:hypothetical protein
MKNYLILSLIFLQVLSIGLSILVLTNEKGDDVNGANISSLDRFDSSGSSDLHNGTETGLQPDSEDSQTGRDFVLYGVDTEIDPSETVNTAWQLGESVNVTYSFESHYIIPESFRFFSSDPDDTLTEWSLTGLSASYWDDTEWYYVTDYDTDDDNYGRTYGSFQVNAFTSGTLYYEMNFYQDTTGTDPDSTEDGSVALSEDFIDADGLISFGIDWNWYSSPNLDYTLVVANHTGTSAYTIFEASGFTAGSGNENFGEIGWDEFRFLQDDIISQLRSEYRQTANTGILQKKLTIPNHEYQSRIEIQLPGDTDSSTIEINPSVTYSITSGNLLSLTDTIPGDYMITWTTSDDLRLIPASDVTEQVLNSSDFESGNLDWDTASSTFSSHTTESSVVFDGSLAFNISDIDANNDTIKNKYVAPNGTYFLHLAHYSANFSGTGLILAYYNSSWTEIALNTSTGYWLQEFHQIQIAGNDSGANLKLIFHSASGELIIDAFQFLAVNLQPRTTGFDETRFRAQWRVFNGRLNPVAASQHVDLLLEEYPSGTDVHSWDFQATNAHGIADFYWYSRLYEQNYNLTATYWDSTSAPVFNNGSCQFSPTSVSQDGYSWEFFGGDEGFSVSASLSAPSLPFNPLATSSVAVANPTNISETIYLDPVNGDYQELYEARNQTYHHSYNLTSGEYTYSSGYSVRKSNVIPRTEWVTASEFPARFIVRNKAGTTLFCTLDELVNLFATYDNSSLWGLGIEGFDSAMAFYLNFEDSINGNSQILFYPRLKNGSLPAYNFPQFQIYPHVYVNLSGSIYDHFFIPGSNVRNRIEIENGSDFLSVSFTFQEVFMGRTFQMRHGFKYNVTESRFHTINHFVCLDQSFADLAYCYEIDATDMARNSPYRPERFTLYNANESDLLNPAVSVDISQVWDAGAYFEDFYSAIEIVSVNGEAWKLDFSDMEEAGFVEKYLNLHDQLMPDNSVRKVLRAGMYGRAYTQGEIVEIDPEFSAKQTTDSRDWVAGYDNSPVTYTGYDALTQIQAGPIGSSGVNTRGSITWDTGITATIASLSDGEFSFYIYSEYMDSGDYVGFGLYDYSADEYWSEAEMMAAVSTAYGQSMYYSDDTFIGNIGTGNHTFSGTDTDNLLSSWQSHHNGAPSSRQYLPVKWFEGSGMAHMSNDVCRAYESSWGTANQRPSLKFTYSTNEAPSTPTINSDSGDVFAGKTHTFAVNHIDTDGYDDIATCYLRYEAGSDDIIFKVSPTGASGSTDPLTAANFDDGDDKVILASSSVAWSGSSNTYVITWTVCLDWDWTDDDSSHNSDAKTDDDSAASSGWATLDVNNDFENDLVIKSISYAAAAFPSGIESGGGTSISDNEWIKGSTSINCSGVLAYQGATTTYPDTTAVDVELSTDGTLRGEDYDDDTLGSSGEFSIAAYAVGSSTDTDYDFTVSLVDWSGSGSSSNWDTGGSGNYYIDSRIDATAPGSITNFQARPDGYAETSEWDDDTTIYLTWTAATDSDSGIYGAYYDYNDATPDDHNTTGVQETDIGTEGNDVLFYARAIDNVGNVGEVVSDSISIDLTDPTLDGAVFTDDGYAPNWYDQGADSLATIQVSWTETNIDQVWVTVSGIATYSDSSPSGGTSTFNIAISGESDGSYDISFYGNDSAGRSFSDETGSYGDAPLKLDDTGPSSYSIAMAAGIFHADETNDMSPDVVVSGASDGSGVGLHSNPYYFGWRVNDGSWTYPGWQASATWTGSFATDSSNYDFQVKVRDLLGNEGTAVYDNDNVVEDDAPTDLSIYQILESSNYLYASGSTLYYQNLGAGTYSFTVYVEASDAIAGLEKATFPNTVSTGGDDATENGGAYEYEFSYDVIPTESYSGIATVTVYDQAGNSATVTFSVVPTSTGSKSDYYEIMVFPDAPIAFTVSLTDVDWRLYRLAIMNAYWNGSTAFEVALNWSDVELASYQTFGASANWRKISFDVTGTHGSENDRSKTGTLKFIFRNTNGAATDVIRIKWARLSYYAYADADSDWSFAQPGDYDGWNNGSDTLCDVSNNILQLNSTADPVPTDAILYRNETVQASDYNIFSIYARSSENTTIQFQNGSGTMIGNFSCTTAWNNYIVTLNSAWANTQTDLLIVWPLATDGDWFEINWLIMEKNQQLNVIIDDSYMRFYSQNNSHKLRIRIDGKLIGDYWELEDIPLNVDPGTHYVEYIAFYSSQTPSNGYDLFLHSRGYYFTYTVNAFQVTIESLDLSDDYVHLGVQANLACTYSVYENDTNIASGSLGTVSTVITHVRNTTIGLMDLDYFFNASGTTLWKNFSYSNAASDVFHLTNYHHTSPIQSSTTTIQVTWATSLTGATLTVYQDSSKVVDADTTSPSSWTKATPEGTHTVVLVWSKSPYSNIVETFTFDVDNTLPIWEGTPANNSNVERYTTNQIDWALGEIVNWQIEKNSSVVSSGTSPIPQYSWTTNSDVVSSVYWFKLTCTSLGGVTNTSNVFFTLVDTIAPVITYDSGPTNGSTAEWGNTFTLQFSFSESSNVAIYQNSVEKANATGVTSFSYSWDTSGLSHGITWNLTLYASDGTNSDTYYLSITTADSVLPTATISSSTQTMEASDENFVVKWEVYDLHPDTFNITFDGEIVSSGSWTGVSSLSYTVPIYSVAVSGSYILQLSLNDTAANIGSSEVTIDVVSAANIGGPLDQHADDQDQTSDEMGLPWFEILFFFLAALGILSITRKRKVTP